MLSAGTTSFISDPVLSDRENLCRVPDKTDTAAAETAPPAAAAQVKIPRKKKAAPRNKSAGPTLSKKILKIVADCTDRRGTSLPAIKKALGRSGVDVGKARNQIKQSIRRNVNKGSLVQSSGTGASGPFKIPKQGTKGNVVKKVKSGAAKKPLVKKTAGKKVTAKKSAAKKLPVKKLAAKKSAKQKAAGKKVNSKKAAKPNKSPAKKAALPKKSPVKKAKKPKSATGGKALKKVQSSRGKTKPKAAKAQKTAPGKN